MERSEVIKKIKELAREANSSIKKKNYQDVYEKYMKIADLCKQINDDKNANNYMQAANKFKERTEVAKKQKDLRDAINRSIVSAKLAYEDGDYSKVSDIYYYVASGLHELGDEVTAKKFSEAARKFREKAALQEVPEEAKAEVSKEIQAAKEVTPFDQFSSAIGFKAEKILSKTKEPAVPFISSTEKSTSEITSEAKPTFSVPPVKKPTIDIPPLAKPTFDAPPIAKPTSKIPSNAESSSEIPSASALDDIGVNVDKLDQFLIAMGLKCPNCGTEISEAEANTSKKCPNCGADLYTL